MTCDIQSECFELLPKVEVCFDIRPRIGTIVNRNWNVPKYRLHKFLWYLSNTTAYHWDHYCCLSTSTDKFNYFKGSLCLIWVKPGILFVEFIHFPHTANLKFLPNKKLRAFYALGKYSSKSCDVTLVFTLVNVGKYRQVFCLSFRYPGMSR